MAYIGRIGMFVSTKCCQGAEVAPGDSALAVCDDPERQDVTDMYKFPEGRRGLLVELS